MNPSSSSRTPALRQHLHRALRALIIGLSLISLSATSFAFDVYRGLKIESDKLDLSPATFSFNPELSLFDADNVQKQPVGAYKCLLRVKLDHAPVQKAEASAVDFTRDGVNFKVRFDNDPAGHYSMLPLKKKGNGTAISNTLQTLHAKDDKAEYKALIIDGTHKNCNEQEAKF